MVAYDSGEIHHVPDILKQSFRDDEPSGQRLLDLFLGDLFQYSLHILQIIMFIPSHRTSRDLNPFADGVVDGFVGDDNVPPLGKGRDDAGNGRVRLRVDNACGHSQMRRNHGLGFHMYILRAIEAGRTARADAVGPQCLDRLLLEDVVGHQIVKVVGRQVRHGSPGGELRLRSGRSGNAVSRDWIPPVVRPRRPRALTR